MLKRDERKERRVAAACIVGLIVIVWLIDQTMMQGHYTLVGGSRPTRSESRVTRFAARVVGGSTGRRRPLTHGPLVAGDPPGDAGLQEAQAVNEFPSLALTRRFLVLCEQYGSERLAVQIVAVGRSTGVEGLPASDDWNTWDAGEMQAAVDYLRRKRGLTR